MPRLNHALRKTATSWERLNPAGRDDRIDALAEPIKELGKPGERASQGAPAEIRAQSPSRNRRLF